jgi:glutamyl-tRNA reductase
MSVLAVGLSHRTSPVSLLERVVLGDDAVVKLLHDATSSEHIAEAAVVATCNRLEVYADVARFHGGITELSELLARHTGVPLETLTPHLYVHYEDRAVQHLFALVCGLESMVVGEAQILGQVRAALRTAQTEGTAGRALNDLVQQALRVGKRAHAETGIDRAAPSIVSAGLDIATAQLGELAGRAAVVVGAGAMGRLAGVHLNRAGADTTYVNRTVAHARRLADDLGGGTAALSDLQATLARAELVVTCTGAVGTVVDHDAVLAARRGSDRPLVMLDLALPHDVDPRVADLPGVIVVGLEQLAEITAANDAEAGTDVEDVRGIVAEEVARYLSAQRSERVSPTVVALRTRASEVVGAELARLESRLPDLDAATREEFAASAARIVEKLLHPPTVRMKELAAQSGGDQYAEALHRLFDLDPTAIDAVTRADLEDGAL